MDRRKRSERIVQAVRRAGRETEADLPAVDVGRDIPALAARGMFHFTHFAVAAEADGPALPLRRVDVGRQHQHAVLR